MRTAADIAQRALIRSGVIAAGETPTAAEISDAVTTLGDMLDSWSLEHLLVFGTTELTAPIAGRARLTIGPTGDLIATRPNSVLTGFVRTTQGDTPVHMASPEFLDGMRDKTAQDDAYWAAYEGAYNYTAFRTDKGLNDFIKRTGVNFIKQNEVMTADHGKVQSFIAENIEIQEKLFWKMEDIPENAVKYTDLSNGSLVDCYYTNESNVYTQYRPNCNAKEVYKPMELKQHIEYISINY